MATVSMQKSDSANEIKNGAAAAINVPGLRDQVVALAELVAELEKKIAALQGRRR